MSAALQLAGRVAAATIRSHLAQSPPGDSFARLLVRSFSDAEIKAVIDAIRNDADLRERVEITLPRLRYEGVDGIPGELLTDRSATNLRTDECAREARLIVVADDGQMQSLAQIETIDPERLMEESVAETWIAVAAEGLAIPPAVETQWTMALTGVMRLGRMSFSQIAGFVSTTGAQIGAGINLAKAVGFSLPELQLPRHLTLFNDIPDQKLQQPSQWKQRLERHARRECFIAKRDMAQIPLSVASLKEKLAAVRGATKDEIVSSLERYITAKPSDAAACFAPFLYDWPEIEAFFEEAQKAPKISLGQLTHDFFELQDPDILTNEDRAYIDVLRQKRATDKSKNPTDDQFYERHGQIMREDARLSGLWDRFIFGIRAECNDLLDGIVQCLQRLHKDAPEGTRRLVVSGDELALGHFMKLNDEACCAFATQYKGLARALDGLVDFRNVKAFDYLSFRQTIADKHSRKADLGSRNARQLKFRVWIEALLDGAMPVKSAELKLTWIWDIEQVGTSLNEDIERLLHSRNKSPIIACKAAKGRTPSRGGENALNLGDIKCLEPLSRQKQGVFIPPIKGRRDLAGVWRAHLSCSIEENLVTEETGRLLAELFSQFEASYGAALAALRDTGWHAAELQTQAEHFGGLIDAVLGATDRPMVLESLLRPILEIGVAQVESVYGSSAAAIVCPWNPLRMAALSARWTQFRQQMLELLSLNKPLFTDNGSMYFSKFSQTLSSPMRPEVVATPESAGEDVFSLVGFLNGYSLHRSLANEVASESGSATAVRGLARQIVALASDYLRIQPHKKDSFSLALFNCDTSALAHAVVEQFRSDAEQRDEAVACQVVVSHRDERQRRALYRELGSRVPDQDGVQTNALGRSFIAPLRISVDTGGAGRSRSGSPPIDIVFCHDVVSRASKRGWTQIKRVIRKPHEIVPDHTRRRIPVRPGEREAILMLEHPVQPLEGWSYLDALASLHDHSRAREARSIEKAMMPVRRADVRDPDLRDIVNETHSLGVWVVNMDDLLDRQQLIGHGIRVIRYRQSEGRDRNVIISSRNPDALLRTTLHNRIRTVDPDYSDAEREELIDRLINDANLLSGDIVLRAAKRGNNASELLGIVLSKYLIDAEIGHRAPQAWIFLDDYASWLGQSEKRIADLLCLAPRPDDEGRNILDIIVTEAKYVKASGVRPKADDSAHQLRDTLTRLESALDPACATVDRGIWLTRLASMLRDGLREHLDGGMTPDDWANCLRDDQCEIRLRGYSHVFAHAAPDQTSPVANEAKAVPHTKSGTQEIYSPSAVRALLRAYHTKVSPDGIRQRAAAAYDLTFSPLTSGAGSVAQAEDAAPPKCPPVGLPIEPISPEQPPVAGSKLRQFIIQEALRARS